MKKVLAMVVFLAIAAVAANFLIKGGLPFMQQLSEEEQEIATLRGELRADPTAQLLQSLPGVGEILGATLALEIGDVDRFANPDRLSCYACAGERIHGDPNFFLHSVEPGKPAKLTTL